MLREKRHECVREAVLDDKELFAHLAGTGDIDAGKVSSRERCVFVLRGKVFFKVKSVFHFSRFGDRDGEFVVPVPSEVFYSVGGDPLHSGF